MSGTMIKSYLLIKPIGKGAMGEIFLAQNVNDKKYYAIKRIVRSIIERPEIRKSVNNERKFLKELEHTNIIRLIEVIETFDYYNIVLDYCYGDSLLKCLKNYITKYKKPFSEEIVQYLMRQIVDGVKCIHKHNIIHRDLKLDNILVKFYSHEDKENINMMKCRIKISDFGISIKADIAFTAAGSPAYADPIIIKKMNARNDLKYSEGYDKSADIWSLGALCYEMLLGRRIFSGRNLDELFKKVEVGNYSVPFNLSKEVVSFLNIMLQYNPIKRAKIDEISQHEFLTKDIKQFRKLNPDLFGSKVEKNGIKMNVKNNKTVSDFLNDEEKFTALNRILDIGTYDEFTSCEIIEKKVNIPDFQAESGLSKKNSDEYSKSNNIMGNDILRNRPIPNSYNIKNDSKKLDSEKKVINKNQINSNNVFNNNSQNNKNSLPYYYKNLNQNHHIHQVRYQTYQKSFQNIPYSTNSTNSNQQLYQNSNQQIYQNSNQNYQQSYQILPINNQFYQNNNNIKYNNYDSSNNTYNNYNADINYISNSANQRYPNPNHFNINGH